MRGGAKRVSLEIGGRLAVERACWRLLCVVEKGSLMGVDREI
jgi:hypothetical protein